LWYRQTSEIKSRLTAAVFLVHRGSSQRRIISPGAIAGVRRYFILRIPLSDPKPSKTE
jgi:hypothetical protein